MTFSDYAEDRIAFAFSKQIDIPYSIDLPKIDWPHVIPKGVDMRKRGFKEVERAALKFGVDPNLALRMAKQESNGRCNVTSSENAKGVLQVVPSTARIHGIRNSNQLYNCRIGAEIGVREIRRVLRIAKGDVVKALVAYNCGPGCLKRKRLPKETRNYVWKIARKRI